MSCLWDNKEKQYNCHLCVVDFCESRHAEFDVGASIANTSIQPPRGHDELDKWLEEECNIRGGACSSIECLKYDVGREVAEKMKNEMVEKVLSYLNNKFYFNNLFYGVVSTDFNSMEEMFEDFKKHMEEK